MSSSRPTDPGKNRRRQLRLGVKRVADVCVCSAILVLGFPFFALIALLVKLSSPGPVFFVQGRVGMKVRVYQMIKFRTMTGQPDPSAIAWTKAEEARITSVGRFLRDFGLDELPQVVNIVKGDMSIIGPRPPLPAQVAAYSPEQLKAFDMRPGVLSLAAVEGRRAIPMEERIALHVRYVEHWSLRLDIWILARSLLTVLRRQNAVETVSEGHEEAKA
jgi:lipopolysaccharide/colanic/teichoic acid biosynthesis glycosyltransferase